MSTSLSNILTNRMSNPIYSNIDKDWFIFIYDHISNLKKQATEISLDPETKYKYDKRFKWFLRDNNISQNLVWMILLINELDKEEDFIERDSLLIITEQVLTTLYRVYKTSKKLK